MTLTESTIPGLELLHRGKVRETYAVGEDRLLLVATDRLSAFDVVFEQPIPDTIWAAMRVGSTVDPAKP